MSDENSYLFNDDIVSTQANSFGYNCQPVLIVTLDYLCAGLLPWLESYLKECTGPYRCTDTDSLH